MLRPGGPHPVLKLTRLRKSPALLATTMTLALYSVALLTFTPRFQTNDDTAMMLIVSGAAYGEPSDQLPFTNIVIAGLLKRFYMIAPDFPWYGMYLYGFQALAIGAIIYSLIVILPKRTPLWPIIVATFISGPIVLIVELQFTSTAMLLGISGILLHVAVSTDARSSWIPHIIAGLLIGVSSLVRWSALLGTLAIGLPLILYHQRWGRAALLRTVVLVATSIAVVTGGIVAERIHQAANPDWKAYLEYNQVRGQLHGTPRLDLDTHMKDELLPEIGWSEVDLTQFRSWFFADPDIYSRDALEYLVAATRDHSTGISAYRSSVLELPLRFPRELAVLGVIVLMVGISRRQRLIWVPPLGYVLWVLGLMVWLSATIRLPDRVAVPMMFLAGLGAITMLSFRDRYHHVQHDARHASCAEPGSRLTGVVVVAAVVLVLTSIPTILEQSESNRTDQEEAVQRASDLLARAPEATYVDWASIMGLHHLHPLRPVPEELRELEVVGLGWRTHSPDWVSHKRERGIEHLLLAIAYDPDVRLVAAPSQVSRLEKLLVERYGRAGEFRAVHTLHGKSGDVYDILVPD